MKSLSRFDRWMQKANEWMLSHNFELLLLVYIVLAVMYREAVMP